MRIDNQNTSATTATRSGRPGEAPEVGRSGQGRAGAHPVSPDLVELSGDASQLSRLLAADAEKRTGQVEKLALEVRAGSYAADAVQISRALVSESLAFQEER